MDGNSSRSSSVTKSVSMTRFGIENDSVNELSNGDLDQKAILYALANQFDLRQGEIKCHSVDDEPVHFIQTAVSVYENIFKLPEFKTHATQWRNIFTKKLVYGIKSTKVITIRSMTDFAKEFYSKNWTSIVDLLDKIIEYLQMVLVNSFRYDWNMYAESLIETVPNIGNLMNSILLPYFYYSPTIDDLVKRGKSILLIEKANLVNKFNDCLKTKYLANCVKVLVCYQFVDDAISMIDRFFTTNVGDDYNDCINAVLQYYYNTNNMESGWNFIKDHPIQDQNLFEKNQCAIFQSFLNKTLPNYEHAKRIILSYPNKDSSLPTRLCELLIQKLVNEKLFNEARNYIFQFKLNPNKTDMFLSVVDMAYIKQHAEQYVSLLILNQPKTKKTTFSDKFKKGPHSTGSYDGLNNRLICIVCMDAPVQSVFEPCFHSNLCLQCVRNIEAKTIEGNYISCPSCRSNVISVNPIYY